MSQPATHRTQSRKIAKYSMIAVVSSAALVLSACTGASPEPAPDGTSASWSDTVEQAKQEGEVVVYLALPGIENQIIDGFAKAYPEITVTINRQPTGDLITKLMAESEAKSSGADIAIMSDKLYYTDNVDSFIPLAGDSTELYKDFTGPVSADSDGRYLPVITMPFGIAYNPDRVKQLGADPIETYEDLLQPELKGSIGLTRADITPVSLQWFSILDRELGSDFLPALGKQEPRLYPSVNPIMQAVAAGDLAAGLYAQPAAAGAVRDAGAPIIDVYPDPKFFIIYFEAITDWATHPAAAQVFVNWLASEDGQAAVHSWGRTGSVLPDIKGTFEMESIDNAYDGILSDEERAFNETWDEIFLK